MDYDNDLTIAARVKDWEIFTPNWNYLQQHPAMELGSLCAMSVGLHPAFASLEWVFNVATPHFDGSKRDLADLIPSEDRDALFDSDLDDAHIKAFRLALLDKFVQRARIAAANLTPLGLLPIAVGEPDGERTLVRVAEFAAWAAGMGWSLPDELTCELSTEGDTTLSDNERKRLLKHIALLAMALAEKGQRYKRGDKPNANQIAEAVKDILEALPDANGYGAGASSIRESISAGIALLNE